MMETRVSQSNMDQQLAGLSPAQRKLLELRLMQKNRRAKTTQSIERRVERTKAPLSYNQQGLWVLNQLMPGESLYHSPTAARLTGPLNVEALVKTLQTIVARHDGLRTIFKIVDGVPRQVVQEFTLDVPLIDLSGKSEAERDEEALRILRH